MQRWYSYPLSSDQPQMLADGKGQHGDIQPIEVHWHPSASAISTASDQTTLKCMAQIDSPDKIVSNYTWGSMTCTFEFNCYSAHACSKANGCEH